MSPETLPRLSLAERRQMLADIGTVALAVGRDLETAAPDALPASSGAPPGLPSPRERLALYQDCLPAIERALRAICARPLSALQSRLVTTPISRVRRPHPLSLLRAVRQRAESEGASGREEDRVTGWQGDQVTQSRVERRESRVESSGAGDPPPDTQTSELTTYDSRLTTLPLPACWLAQRLGGRLPRTLTETVSEPTTDIPANRYAVGRVAAWRRDLRAIASLAEWEERPDIRAEALRLETRLRHYDLSSVGDPDSLPWQGSSMQPTETVLRDPRYRALFTLDRRMRRELCYAWEAPALMLAPKEEWLLYEMWCFFRTAAALRGMGLRATGGDAVRLAQGRLTVTLAKGRASLLRFQRASGAADGDSCVLFYNRSYPSATVGSAEASSRTYTMIPDISLERNNRLFLLDAKFRAYARPGEEQEDIARMHAYRDAIVRTNTTVVDGAWCLYPGPPTGGLQVIAYPAATAEKPFGTAGIGAIRLRPLEDETVLARLLRAWLTA